MLNREAILAAQDLRTEVVEVPEWGGSVIVRMMTGAERNTLHTRASAGGSFDASVFASVLIEVTTVDESGARVFAEGDAAFISAKSAAAIQRVFDASAKLNGLGADAVDVAAKNSPADPSAASS